MEHSLSNIIGTWRSYQLAFGRMEATYGSQVYKHPTSKAVLDDYMERLRRVTRGRISNHEQRVQFEAALYHVQDNVPPEIDYQAALIVKNPVVLVDLAATGFFNEADNILAVKWLQWFAGLGIPQPKQALVYKG